MSPHVCYYVCAPLPVQSLGTRIIHMKLRPPFGRRIAIGTWCGLMVLLLAVPALATTVVALIDNRHHRAVIAADSLLTFKLAEATTETCKIVARPSCSFAMAGLFYKEDPVFHLQELADQACSQPGDLRKKADAFLEIARDPVMSVAQYLQQNEPDFYRDLTNSNAGELIMVVFVGPELGNPSIYARGYKLEAGRIVAISFDVTKANNGAGYFGGANQQIAAYIKKHPNWDSGDKVKTARKLVQLEITAHPEWVGPPISVLTVNRLDQQHWASPGVCVVPTTAPKKGENTNP